MAKFDQYRDFTFKQFIEEPRFRNWVLNSFSEDDAYFSELRRTYEGLGERMDEARTFLEGTRDYFEQSDLSEEEILVKLRNTFQQTSHSAVVQKGLFGKYYRYAVAASVMVLLCIGGWYIFSDRFVSTVYATGYGEWENVDLPDGSHVKLNANSELEVSKNWFSGNVRKVTLSGEAYFEVARILSTDARFQVITNDLIIEVLGTSFNVHSRGEDTKVFLEEGKVKLDLGEMEEFMEPGDFVSYSSREKAITLKTNLKEQSLTSWKEGVLIMNDTRVSDILEKIEEIYGVEILVGKDSIVDEIMTIGVPMEALDIVIPMLEKSLDISITREGNTLTIN